MRKPMPTLQLLPRTALKTPKWSAKSASASSFGKVSRSSVSRSRIALVERNFGRWKSLANGLPGLQGLERTDNNMKQTSWPEVTPINQKNYYTYVSGPFCEAKLRGS